MRKISFLIALLFILSFSFSFAQDVPGAVSFHIYSSHTSFPDSGRVKGHLYDSVLYTFKDHYSDSTVLIIAPKKLDAKQKVDLVFWFHGWRNNVDSAAIRYELTKQFIESKRNAVLVLAETGRNTPDSYGGKLEKPGVFSGLVGDVLHGLKDKKMMAQNCKEGNILLGGHSGAYRVMARIIKNGSEPIQEAMLFDALYGETDIFLNWLKADASHRFIHLFTDHGGTFDESHIMSGALNNDHKNPLEIEEKDITPALLQSHPVVFIHSLKEHNDIVNPDNFRLMLENTPFLKGL